MTTTSEIDAVNRRAMASRQAVAQYRAAQGLEPAERAALAALAGEVRDQPVLDLGVGGGRTVEPLRALSADYIGIDYSAEMVAAASARFPDAAIHLGDACELAAYPADHFQLAVFSCNGLGMMSHGDRLRALAAIRRVLRPGGTFVFSTHNRRSPVHAAAFALPELDLDLHDPLRAAVRAARFARGTARRAWNRARHWRHELATHEYAIKNGASHDYGVMLYLIDLAAQRRQLANAGFGFAAAYDLSGARVEAADTTDDSILYVARKS